MSHLCAVKVQSAWKRCSADERRVENSRTDQQKLRYLIQHKGPMEKLKQPDQQKWNAHQYANKKDRSKAQSKLNQAEKLIRIEAFRNPVGIITASACDPQEKRSKD